MLMLMAEVVLPNGELTYHIPERPLMAVMMGVAGVVLNLAVVAVVRWARKPVPRSAQYAQILKRIDEVAVCEWSLDRHNDGAVALTGPRNLYVYVYRTFTRVLIDGIDVTAGLSKREVRELKRHTTAVAYTIARHQIDRALNSKS